MTSPKKSDDDQNARNCADRTEWEVEIGEEVESSTFNEYRENVSEDSDTESPTPPISYEADVSTVSTNTQSSANPDSGLVEPLPSSSAADGEPESSRRRRFTEGSAFNRRNRIMARANRNKNKDDDTEITSGMESFSLDETDNHDSEDNADEGGDADDSDVDDADDRADDSDVDDTDADSDEMDDNEINDDDDDEMNDDDDDEMNDDDDDEMNDDDDDEMNNDDDDEMNDDDDDEMNDDEMNDDEMNDDDDDEMDDDDDDEMDDNERINENEEMGADEEMDDNNEWSDIAEGENCQTENSDDLHASREVDIYGSESHEVYASDPENEGSLSSEDRFGHSREKLCRRADDTEVDAVDEVVSDRSSEDVGEINRSNGDDCHGVTGGGNGSSVRIKSKGSKARKRRVDEESTDETPEGVGPRNSAGNNKPVKLEGKPSKVARLFSGTEQDPTEKPKTSRKRDKDEDLRLRIRVERTRDRENRKLKSKKKKAPKSKKAKFDPSEFIDDEASETNDPMTEESTPPEDNVRFESGSRLPGRSSSINDRRSRLTVREKIDAKKKSVKITIRRRRRVPGSPESDEPRPSTSGGRKRPRTPSSESSHS